MTIAERVRLMEVREPYLVEINCLARTIHHLQNPPDKPPEVLGTAHPVRHKRTQIISAMRTAECAAGFEAGA